MEKNNEKWYDLNDPDFKSNNINEDEVVYRIIPFDSLLQMLNERTNTLVKINLWEDKYENFILKENIIHNGKKKDLKTLSEMFYGQCWTSRQSSDAMWRIYSPDKKSVRIKTTIGKLKKMLETHKDGDYRINKVKYYSQKQIQDDIRDLKVVKEDDLITLVIQSLFVKRNSFSHESEYRIIFSTEENTNEPIKVFQVDPYDFIENIYFDPRADDAYVKRCQRILNKAFQYPIIRIHKSTLYSFKQQNIIIE